MPVMRAKHLNADCCRLANLVISIVICVFQAMHFCSVCSSNNITVIQLKVVSSFKCYTMLS